MGWRGWHSWRRHCSGKRLGNDENSGDWGRRWYWRPGMCHFGSQASRLQSACRGRELPPKMNEEGRVVKGGGEGLATPGPRLLLGGSSFMAEGTEGDGGCPVQEKDR